MKIIDKPFLKIEKDNMLRMLDGCICRICVSDKPEEIVRMIGFANNYISTLAQNRMNELKEKAKKLELKRNDL